MTDLHRYTDIHSHRRADALRGDTVVCIEPGEAMEPGGTYSVGIHPWSTASGPVAQETLEQLAAQTRDSRVVAIGECGFDRLRGGDMAEQQRLFEFQARLAAELGKPLIIHCVRAFDLLLGEAKRLKPEPGSWIVHGFRGKPELARQLLDAGLGLSLGKHYNAATAAMIPDERKYCETDEMDD